MRASDSVSLYFQGTLFLPFNILFSTCNVKTPIGMRKFENNVSQSAVANGSVTQTSSRSRYVCFINLSIVGVIVGYKRHRHWDHSLVNWSMGIALFISLSFLMPTSPLTIYWNPTAPYQPRPIRWREMHDYVSAKDNTETMYNGERMMTMTMLMIRTSYVEPYFC